MNSFGKAAMGIEPKERALVGVALAGDGNAWSLRDLPETIMAQAPEREFRMHSLAVRSEPTQQAPDSHIDLLEGHQTILTPETATERPKDEKRLVGSTLSANVPNTECFDAGEELLGGHEQSDGI